MDINLKTLDRLRIASPCGQAWADMAGDDRSRFCTSCSKNVYNLTAMTREQAVKLIVEKEGRLCIRAYQRRDGTVILGDCPIGLRRARRQLAKLVGSLAAMLAFLLGCTWPVGNAVRRRVAISLLERQPFERVGRWLDREQFIVTGVMSPAPLAADPCSAPGR